MKQVALIQPKKLVLGEGALDELMDFLRQTKASRLFVVVDPHVLDQVKPFLDRLGAGCKIHQSPGKEPSFNDFQDVHEAARKHQAELVLGMGGGSVLDLAKLVAALLHVDQPISDFIGKGRIGARQTPLVCVPTTSGAGSESSPNAILIDDSDNSKKGIIDEALIADRVFIDPKLMVSVPPDVTAYTGLDALTHCIEAYANKQAHPVIDTYSMEGIRLISKNLGKAIVDGHNLEARTNIALGAYYGGMCLGPVNTAAVHALAYPLGTRYQIAHGLSNALLLPYVMEYNLEAAPQRYAEIARVMGAEELSDVAATAMQGIERIRQLINECGMPARLSSLNIDERYLADMAKDALKIQRLLVNNPRVVRYDDAVNIYKNAM